MSSGGWQVYSRELLLATVMMAGYGEDISTMATPSAQHHACGHNKVIVETRIPEMSYLSDFIHSLKCYSLG